MELPKGVILLDSLGDLQPENTEYILVCGSHCGGNLELAKQVKNCNVQAVFLNNAGIGKNNAGIKGLSFYETQNILACAVNHNSAQIGIAQDTWECGIISHANNNAQLFGIEIGDTVQQAVEKIINKTNLLSTTNTTLAKSLNATVNKDNKVDLKKQTHNQIQGITVTVTDSITFLNESNSGHIVICGSHGGLSAGHYAQKHKVKAVFFNDAGIGKNNAGIKSLEILSDAGILACTVDCLSAEIFNGQDVLENGIITVCNKLAKSRNIQEKMTVKQAITLI